MRRTLTALGLALVTLTAFAHDHGKGHGRRHSGMNISINDDFTDVTDCSALKVSFDGDRVPVVTEEIPAGSVSSLRVTTSANGGGVRVTGGSSRGYAIRLCKAVKPGLNASAIRASLRGNELTVSGPDEEGWVGYFLVTTPRGADVELRAQNGPIGIDTVEGRVRAHATNGPVSLKDSTGDIEVSTQNGPISLAGGSGDVKATAQNGPLSVKLTGGSWIGNLDASTQNGPLTVKLPRGYRSGVSVEARGGGPINCRAEGCWESQAKASRNNDDDDDDWNRDRRFEFGSGPANVKLSTVNGPLSIKNAD